MNGESRDTGNIVHNTQNEHKPKVYICFTTSYVEVFCKTTQWPKEKVQNDKQNMHIKLKN